MVNRRVAWADKRENKKYAAFDARIIVSLDEQEQTTLEVSEPLQQLSRIGEHQISTGEGEDAPSQPMLRYNCSNKCERKCLLIYIKLRLFK